MIEYQNGDSNLNIKEKGVMEYTIPLKSKWLETMIMIKILMAKNNGFVENPQRLETNDFYRPVKAKNRH